MKLDKFDNSLMGTNIMRTIPKLLSRVARQPIAFSPIRKPRIQSETTISRRLLRCIVTLMAGVNT